MNHKKKPAIFEAEWRQDAGRMELFPQKIKRARLPVRALLNFSDETDELASLTNRVATGRKNIAAAKKSRYFPASQPRACIAIR
jgi:hypothetical protein